MSSLLHEKVAVKLFVDASRHKLKFRIVLTLLNTTKNLLFRAEFASLGFLIAALYPLANLR